MFICAECAGESPETVDGASLSRAHKHSDNDVIPNEPPPVVVPPPGVPPPPPPPPPPPSQSTDSPPSVAYKDTMQAILAGGVSLRPVSPQPERPKATITPHSQVMEAIKGGVNLKSVPHPQEKPAGEEKVVDVASELRMRMLKRKKKEVCECVSVCV